MRGQTAEPKDWVWSKTKHIAKFHTGWTPPTGDSASFEGNNLWANISDLGPKELQDTAKRISDDAVKKSSIKLTPAGSLLFSFKLSIGQVSFAAHDMYTNEAIATFPRQDGLNTRWAYYAFPVFIPLNAGENIYGAKLLNQELIRAADLLLPPLSEQERIANFLDEKTARIDALIAQKELLVEKLGQLLSAELRQLCLGSTNAETDDRVADWRWSLPKGWTAPQIKHCVKPKRGAIKTGPFGSQLTSAEMVGGSIKVYNQRSVIAADFAGGDEYISTAKFDDLASFETSPGDVLVTTRGTIGRAAVLPPGSERGILHPCLLRIQCDENKLIKEFLVLLIQDSGLLLSQLRHFSDATTIEVIYSGTMSMVRLPLPPLQTQRDICARAEMLKSTRNGLNEHALLHIDRLREYRSSLISAAVTGQINIAVSKAPMLDAA